ncbi:TonB-dependent receptor domain-containing protein [Sporomusa termitida]|uniref:Colicin I receptor n=1 Tax=Sporomusa termitida TaxID=2377 RepID=A0A517DZJ6_9FIRM|nr:TonB-dependent receptor [Sporomusa termitida]QDR82676.1 Colicin I receptor [Sporomusa termitida]
MEFGNKRNKGKIGLLALGLGVAMSLSAYAAEDELIYQFDEVVVTAAGFEQSIVDAPASITVITKEEINRRGYTNLADILSDVEGVDVRGSTGRLGVSNISIRGMSSDHTLIMVDGIPQNGSGTKDIGPNGFHSSVGTFVPPLAAIERVEVIRGPMSTLYGSDALGGVVNIITKKVSDEWHHNLTLDYTFFDDSDRGSVSRYSFYSSGPLTEDKVGLALRGNFLRRAGSISKNEQGNEMSGRGANANPAPLRNYSLGGKVTWKQDDSNSLWLDVDTATSDFSAPYDGSSAAMRFERDKLTIGSDNKVAYGDWRTTLTYNSTETIGYADRKLKNDNLIFDTKLVAPVNDAHTLTVGGRYWDSQLEDGVLTNNGFGKLSIKSTSLFAEDEWQLQDDLALTYGARYDHYDTYGGHTSPRGYLVWKASDKWTLKGGVSTGFKAPSLAQSTDGVTGYTGGIGNQNPTLVYGNPDLKPEQSVNKELGFYYQDHTGFSANATLFHTDYKNKIDSLDLGDNAQTFINTIKGKANGLELGSKIPLAADLALNLNYTYTTTEQIGGNDDGAPLSSIPKHAVNARLNWQADEKTNAWLRAEHRSKMNRYTTKLTTAAQQELEYYKAYTVLDLGVARKLSENTTLNFAVNNLLDKDFSKGRYVNGTFYYDYFSAGRSTGGTYLAGRNYWVSMNYNF